MLQERNSTAEAFAQSIVEYATTAWAVRLAGWRMGAGGVGWCVCVRVRVWVCARARACVWRWEALADSGIVFCVYFTNDPQLSPPPPLSMVSSSFVFVCHNRKRPFLPRHAPAARRSLRSTSSGRVKKKGRGAMHFDQYMFPYLI